MISTILRSYVTAVAAVLFAAAPCCADLFAVVSPSNNILRIDSATGTVTQTYTNPFLGAGQGPVTSGLTFDGRTLYMSRHTPSFDNLYRYDVVDDFWYPPTMLDTFSNPSGQPQALSGLGIVPDGFGGGNLIAVSRNPV